MAQLTFIFPNEDSETFYTGDDGAPRKGDVVALTTGPSQGGWLVDEVAWEYGERGLRLIAVYLVEVPRDGRSA